MRRASRSAAITQFRETLPNGKSYEVLDRGDDRRRDETGVYHRARRPCLRDGRQSRRQRATAASAVEPARASASCRWRISRARRSSPSARPTARPTGSCPGPGSPPRAGAGSGKAFERARSRDWLAATFGHRPRDLGRFERALTHGSQAAANYERLEFLGDRVLGLVDRRMAVRAVSRTSPKASCRSGSTRWSPARSAPRSRASIGVQRPSAARQAGARRRRGRQRQCAGRRDGGADRRALSRCRAGAARALHPPRLGRPGRAQGDGARSIPSRRCRNGPPRTTASRPAYEVVDRSGPHHAPRFTVNGRASASSPKPSATALTNRKPKPRPPRRA